MTARTKIIITFFPFLHFESIFPNDGRTILFLPSFKNIPKEAQERYNTYNKFRNIVFAPNIKSHCPMF
jgi:hypothetical protein